jgi:cob(I)alamin adenosyltransferase
MYFTGKGDKGKTEINGKKFAKDSPIFEVLGELDELNSLIGLAKNYLPKKFFKKLTEIQNDLFVIQANVAYHLINIAPDPVPESYTRAKLGIGSRTELRSGSGQSTVQGKRQTRETKFNLPKLKGERIKELEKEIREIEKKIKTQKSFVIYGSDKDSAWFDYLRGVTRRVERRMIGFTKKYKLDDEILSYINRLSSYFYALARFICYNKRKKERSPWY